MTAWYNFLLFETTVYHYSFLSSIYRLKNAAVDQTHKDRRRHLVALPPFSLRPFLALAARFRGSWPDVVANNIRLRSAIDDVVAMPASHQGCPACRRTRRKWVQTEKFIWRQGTPGRYRISILYSTKKVLMYIGTYLVYN